MHVVGIAGYSGAERATLMVCLIPLLRARSLRAPDVTNPQAVADWLLSRSA